MLVKTFGSAVYGVEAITITVEVNVTNQGQHYFIVGLPDNAVKESLQRVESAIKSNHYYMPRTKLVVNLAPADIKKTGSAFDLPIAIGTLGATEQIQNPERLEKFVIMGELSLDGEVRPIKGALPIALAMPTLFDVDWKYISVSDILKGYKMNKLIAILVAGLFATSVFAQAPATPAVVKAEAKADGADRSSPRFASQRPGAFSPLSFPH